MRNTKYTGASNFSPKNPSAENLPTTTNKGNIPVKKTNQEILQHSSHACDEHTNSMQPL